MSCPPLYDIMIWTLTKRTEPMLSNEPADFIKTFVEDLNNFLNEFKPDAVMTRI